MTPTAPEARALAGRSPGHREEKNAATSCALQATTLGSLQGLSSVPRLGPQVWGGRYSLLKSEMVVVRARKVYFALVIFLSFVLSALPWCGEFLWFQKYSFLKFCPTLQNKSL